MSDVATRARRRDQRPQAVRAHLRARAHHRRRLDDARRHARRRPRRRLDEAERDRRRLRRARRGAHPDGRVVGAAESECSRAERRWKTADPYAIRSMAQTRAIGRALRAPLGQIVVLAGYEPRRRRGDADRRHRAAAAQAVRGTAPRAVVKPTTPQLDEIRALLELLDELDPGTDWPRAASRSSASRGR